MVLKLLLLAVIEEQGLTPLFSVLKELKGWPVLEGDKWKDYEFNWMTSISKLRELGYYIDCFIEFSMDVDVKNTTRRVIHVSYNKTYLHILFLVEEESLSY